MEGGGEEGWKGNLGRQSAAASGESRDEQGRKGGETGGRKSVEQTECRVCVERINGGGEDEREAEREEATGRCGEAVISIPALCSVSSQDK